MDDAAPPPPDIDRLHYAAATTLDYVTACGMRAHADADPLATVVDPVAVTCRACRWYLAHSQPWVGCATVMHPDGRSCWHDGNRQSWRRHGRTEACPRAHQHRLVPTDSPYLAEDQALADLAEILAPPMRDRLRVLLADVAED